LFTSFYNSIYRSLRRTLVRSVILFNTFNSMIPHLSKKHWTPFSSGSGLRGPFNHIILISPRVETRGYSYFTSSG